ncbi:hypothetical protein COE50_06290 [Bacillus anthracis]|nr:hypothetical protein COE50_06290 [Bacillus anthracis]
MSEMEIVLTPREVYNILEVKESTLRKYVDVLQREGYTIRKDNRGRREYTKYDVMILENLVEVSQHDGMTLEKSARLIVQKIQQAKSSNLEPEVEPKNEENKMIPMGIQEQIQQQYSVMMEKINYEQQRNLLEMEQRLSEKIDRRNEQVEKRAKTRDEILMKTFREIQETKRLMKEYKEEISVTKEENKAWWMFWK